MLPRSQTNPPFPPPEMADESGLIAVGGDLSTDRLIEAYSQGIFPWYDQANPVMWWMPDPRLVLFVHDFRVSRSLKKSLRNKGFKISVNNCFEQVMRSCQHVEGNLERSRTWITAEMLDAYCELHRLGLAHSVESWLDGELVGGLYGIGLGRMFYGESMFSTRSDASKVSLHYLVELCKQWGFGMIDCQLPSSHLISLGAVSIRRNRFLEEMYKAIALAAPQDAWKPHMIDAREVPC